MTVLHKCFGRRTLLLLLCLTMLCLSVGTLADEAPVVRVKDITYSVEDVQIEYAMRLSMGYYAGMELTEENAAAVMENVLEHFVTRGLVENRVKELHLDQLGENERQALLEQARQSYDSAWQQARNELTQEQATDGQITDYLTANGITVDLLYREMLYSLHVQALLEKEGRSFEVTDEEVDAFYEENYVQPFRERYEGDIPLFENEVLIPGGETLYLPSGYRLIHQLLLPVTEETKEQLAAIEQEAAEVGEQMQAVYTRVAEQALSGGEVSEEDRAAYLTLQDEYDGLQVRHGDVWAAFLQSKQEDIDQITARIESGEDFGAICLAYSSTAEDIVFHPESIYLPDELTQGLQTLEKPGDISQPCLYTDGIHIFYYAMDMESGAAALDDEENRSIVRLTAANTKLEKELAELTEELRGNYEIEIDRSGLTY